MTRPGRLCVDIGDPDNNLVDVEKTFERDEEEVVGRIICRSGDCGRVVKCWSVRPAADYGHISRDSV